MSAVLSPLRRTISDGTRARIDTNCAAARARLAASTAVRTASQAGAAGDANPATLPPAGTVVFDRRQRRAIQLATEGRNVFLTGVAGTGKSEVTRAIISDAQRRKRKVAVAAPTGVAAVNLAPTPAQTIHSLARIAVPNEASDFGAMYSTSRETWEELEMLVLDEIGMVNADFIEWLDIYVRNIRGRPEEPFGGIQLIFVGDFAQLGPIAGKHACLAGKHARPNEKGADLVLGVTELHGCAFQTALWREARFVTSRLRRVYRQGDDLEFVRALLDVRAGAELPTRRACAARRARRAVRV